MAKFDGSKVIEHLRTKWHGRSCRMCNAGNWNVQESTYQLIEFNQGLRHSQSFICPRIH